MMFGRPSIFGEANDKSYYAIMLTGKNGGYDRAWNLL